MIVKKGSIEVHEDGAHLEEMLRFVDGLPTGKYDYVLVDGSKNRSLPQLKYLFGVVLKTISREHPQHPPVNALYRYFEEIYAPLHTCDIDGEKFEYLDLKNEKSTEVDDVIQCIIHHAKKEWGIKVPTREELKTAEAKALYADAYMDCWKDYQHIISTNK